LSVRNAFQQGGRCSRAPAAGGRAARPAGGGEAPAGCRAARLPAPTWSGTFTFVAEVRTVAVVAAKRVFRIFLPPFSPFLPHPFWPSRPARSPRPRRAMGIERVLLVHAWEPAGGRWTPRSCPDWPMESGRGATKIVRHGNLSGRQGPSTTSPSFFWMSPCFLLQALGIDLFALLALERLCRAGPRLLAHQVAEALDGVAERFVSAGPCRRRLLRLPPTRRFSSRLWSTAIKLLRLGRGPPLARQLLDRLEQRRLEVLFRLVSWCSGAAADRPPCGIGRQRLHVALQSPRCICAAARRSLPAAAPCASACRDHRGRLRRSSSAAGERRPAGVRGRSRSATAGPATCWTSSGRRGIGERPSAPPPDRRW